MGNFVEVKATRNYDIGSSPGIGRCDLCKSYKEVYEVSPEERLHNFDNIFLCKICITKCKLDIREGVLNEIDEQARDRKSSKPVEYDTE